MVWQKCSGIRRSYLEKSLTKGITASTSKACYGVYSTSDVKKFVRWELVNRMGGEMDYALLAHTGCKRAVIAMLRKTKINFDEDCKRHYLLIMENGQGKTGNATRRVIIHLHRIEWGFRTLWHNLMAFFSPVSREVT